jgi:hypothetical protein
MSNDQQERVSTNNKFYNLRSNKPFVVNHETNDGFFSSIRKAYGPDTLLSLRKFAKNDFMAKKTLLDKKYLNNCLQHHIFPNFLNIKIGPQNRKQIKLAEKFKIDTVKNEIKLKRESCNRYRTDRSKFELLLIKEMGKTNFDLTKDKIVKMNHNKLKNTENIHHKKFCNLLIKSGYLKENCSTDITNTIFNESKHKLTPHEERALQNGLKFVIPPKKVDEIGLYSNIELLLDGLHREKEFTEKIPEVGTLCSREVINALGNFNINKPSHNMLSLEQKALISLSKNKELVISKPDKGNGVVIMNRDDYVNKMLEVLNDTDKFNKLSNIDTYNEITGLERKVRSVLKSLKKQKKLDPILYRRIYPSGSRPGLLYGLPKVHKKGTPLRPIMSAVGSPVHGLAQYMVPILAPITTNEFTVSNSLLFADEIRTLHPEKLHLASYDVSSLFTNVPLEETIEIIIQANLKGKLHKTFKTPQLRKILSLCTSECKFLFNGDTYEQKDGVAMGSPLGPTLANIFMVDFEEKYVKTAPDNIKPAFYKRYVDDILVGFQDATNIEKFWQHINEKHQNIKFTTELESDGKISFLDILISKNDENTSTSTFRKKTFTGLITKFNSFIYNRYKDGLISCLLYRAYKICSDIHTFGKEVDWLRELFVRNRFPIGTFNKIWKDFKKKHLDPNDTPDVEPTPEIATPPDTVPTPEDITTPDPETNEIYRTLVLPYFGEASVNLRKGLLKTFKQLLPLLNIRIVFSTPPGIGSLFKFKDKIPEDLRTNLVYEYKCPACSAGYVGSTTRHFRSRILEHQGISDRNGKQVDPNNTRNTAVGKHMKKEGHEPTAESFKILYSSKERKIVRVAESILIQRGKPKLNGALGSFTLRVHPSNLKPEFGPGRHRTRKSDAGGDMIITCSAPASHARPKHDYILRSGPRRYTQ